MWVGLSRSVSACGSGSPGGKTEDIDHQLLLQLGQHRGGEGRGEEDAEEFLVPGNLRL